MFTFNEVKKGKIMKNMKSFQIRSEFCYYMNYKRKKGRERGREI